MSVEEDARNEILRAIHQELHLIRKWAQEIRPELDKWVIWLTSAGKH